MNTLLFQPSLDTATANALAVMSAVLLVLLLLLKEMSTSSSGRFQTWGRLLNVAILPLLIVFGITIMISIIEMFGR